MIFVRDKKFYTTLVAFALPIARQQLITVGVNMADNIMLDNFLSKSYIFNVMLEECITFADSFL